MKRSLSGAIAMLALTTAAPALAADYPMFGAMRPSYGNEWGQSEEGPLRFETGLRYWYSWNEQKHNIGSYSQDIKSTSSSGEAFVRIDDDSTSTFVEATGGYGIAHEGSYSTNGGGSLDLPAARLGYVGADFGWTPFGDATGQVGLGFVAGYQFSNDSPDTGSANFTTAQSSSDISWSPTTGAWGVGGDSEVNSFDIHSLKLGLTGRADFGGFDLTGEAAAIPYAWVSGTYGAYSSPWATPTQLQASAVSLNGFGYGASGKLMVGFHPTENLTIRVGGRASYLEGQYDASWEEASVTPPQATGGNPAYSAPSLTKQRYVVRDNPFSMFRYGALLEIAGRF